MPRPDQPRIAVLGAGPVGLEAALTARVLGFPVTVYERGRVGEYVQRWGHVRMFTPFGMNVTPLGRAAIRLESPKHDWPPDADCQTGRDYVAAYLEPLAMTAALIECLKLETQVVHELKLKGANQGWELEATTRVQVKALFSALNAIDLKLPLPRPSGVAVIGTAAPGLAFPGVLPWGGIWKSFGVPWAYADPDEFTVLDDQGTPLKLV